MVTHLKTYNMIRYNYLLDLRQTWLTDPATATSYKVTSENISDKQGTSQYDTK